MSLPEEPQSVNLSNINDNIKSLRYINDLTSLTYGLSAGILNLESLQGFAYFSVLYLFVNALFIVLICEGKPSLFFQSPWKVIFIDGLWRSLIAFVMCWCLSYSLVQG